MKSFSNLKAEVSHTTQTMLRKARKNYSVVNSRGKWLGHLDTSGEPCYDKDEWRGTKRQLLKYVERHKDTASEIYIELGVDGATCVRDMTEGLYDPWVEADSVVVWDPIKGWYF